jgi:hypothetical protein
MRNHFFFMVLIALVAPLQVFAQGVQLDDLPIEQLTWGEFDTGRKKSAFKTWMHDVNPETIARACSWQLAKAQWQQDLLAIRESAAHFDNCAFDEALEFIGARLDEADAFVGKKEYGKAMFSLGQALHALQDFYSHSNFIELAVADSPNDSTRSQPVSFWAATGRTALKDLVARGLVSGTVPYSRAETKRCSAGAPTHEMLAKDSPTFSKHASTVISGWGNKTYHVAALDLADAATRQYLAYAFQRWPDLGKACGKPVGFLTLVERRKPE